jgi:hypothetical protein
MPAWWESCHSFPCRWLAEVCQYRTSRSQPAPTAPLPLSGPVEFTQGYRIDIGTARIAARGKLVVGATNRAPGILLPAHQQQTERMLDIGVVRRNREYAVRAGKWRHTKARARPNFTTARRSGSPRTRSREYGFRTAVGSFDITSTLCSLELPSQRAAQGYGPALLFLQRSAVSP